MRRSKKKWIFAKLLLFPILYVSYGVYLYYSQESLIYLPSDQDFFDCQRFGEVEKLDFAGTRMYVSGTEKPVVVLYHGNAGSACDRYFYAEWFRDAGYDYAIVEYAGYGNDPRRSSHKLLKQDVGNVLDFLEERRVENVVVVGESIGTGPASYHSSLLPPEKLLLIAPFTDLHGLARKHFWYYPASLLVDNAFDNVTALRNHEGKVTIIHGERDRIVPQKMGVELYESITTEKKFVSIKPAGHNDLFYYQETLEAIENFLKPGKQN